MKTKAKKIKAWAVANEDFVFTDNWLGIFVVQLFPSLKLAKWDIKEGKRIHCKVVPVQISIIKKKKR